VSGVGGAPRRSGPVRALANMTSPLGRMAAGHRLFPLYALLHHKGRTSGRAYATPVVARKTVDGFVIPLPFGDRTQWSRNLLAAGGGTLRYAGRDYPITQPEVVEFPAVRDAFNRAMQFGVDRLGIRHFVRVRRVNPARSSAAAR
jgi:hypothetical protein